MLTNECSLSRSTHCAMGVAHHTPGQHSVQWVLNTTPRPCMTDSPAHWPCYVPSLFGGSLIRCWTKFSLPYRFLLVKFPSHLNGKYSPFPHAFSFLCVVSSHNTAHTVLPNKKIYHTTPTTEDSVYHYSLEGTLRPTPKAVGTRPNSVAVGTTGTISNGAGFAHNNGALTLKEERSRTEAGGEREQRMTMMTY
jgi:hypothetical protein